MESLMTKVILADLLIFVLYLLCAGKGWMVFKVVTAIISIFGSLLCLGWLYMTGEFPKRRSLWMITAFACIAGPYIGTLGVNMEENRKISAELKLK